MCIQWSCKLHAINLIYPEHIIQSRYQFLTNESSECQTVCALFACQYIVRATVLKRKITAPYFLRSITSDKQLTTRYTCTFETRITCFRKWLKIVSGSFDRQSLCLKAGYKAEMVLSIECLISVKSQTLPSTILNYYMYFTWNCYKETIL